MLSRRTMLAAAAAAALPAAKVRAALPELRLGVLQFGTVQWIADVIRRHDLDTKHNFTLRSVTLANTDAGRVSLMAGASDVFLSDWPFVAVQRAAGNKLCFAGFSSATGGIMTAQDSPIRTLSDLKGRKLGIAGGPADKSWLAVRAAAHASAGLDLAAAANCVYGAPPLIGAKLQQNELDAVLTFWNFAAKLEAAGCRQAVSVADCLQTLGIDPRISMVGWVFHQDFAPIDNFLRAVDDAQRLLADSPAEWTAIRPLMNADSDALFQRLQDRYKAGMVRADARQQEQGANRLLSILHTIGGTQATGGLDAVPPGVFWPVHNGTG